MSIFLGDQLTDVFEQIKNGGAKSSKASGVLTIGVDTLPPLPKHAGDRNRTSPVAFTGNKFEFRAVGSNQSIAGPLMVLSTILTESLDYIATRLEKETAGQPEQFNAAVQGLLKEIISEHGQVIFNGDGYAEAWHKEAEFERGLPNLKTSFEALPAFESEEAINLFEHYGVMSHRETKSRLDVYLEQYVNTVQVEARLMIEMARTLIYPAAIRFQGELASTAVQLQSLGLTYDKASLDQAGELTGCLKESTDRLENLITAHHADDLLAEAEHACHQVLPAMSAVRHYADALEGIVADDLWPLPTYQEMLFIK
jgi:glutamine synthetase